MIPIAASAALSAASSLASILGAASGSAASSATTAAAGTSSATTAKGTASTAKGDTVNQADFMQLLIAQLQNQDPLNPLDSANFSAQLAQFSSLQQLTEINASLKKGGTGAGAVSSVGAVGFLGKEVRGVSDQVTVANGKASTLDFTLTGSGVLHAQIINAAGKAVVPDLVIGTQDPGTHTLDLSGMASAGQLPDGTYKIKLAVVGSDGKASSVDTLGGGIVTGVDLSGDAPTLLIGSIRIPLADVRQVQEPPPAA